jgi:hypothetical protein
MADLDTYAKREAHARRLARRYGLAPHAVETRTTLASASGAGRAVSVAWIESSDALIDAGLVTREQIGALLEQQADPEIAHTGLQWSDAAGTRWVLSTNGGERGDEYGVWLTAWYPPDAEALPPEADSPAFCSRVEDLVRLATGRPIRFADRKM